MKSFEQTDIYRPCVTQTQCLCGSLSAAHAESPCELSSWLGTAQKVPALASTLPHAGMCPMTLFSIHSVYSLGKLHLPKCTSFSFLMPSFNALEYLKVFRMEGGTMDTKRGGDIEQMKVTVPGQEGTSQASSQNFQGLGRGWRQPSISTAYLISSFIGVSGLLRL